MERDIRFERDYKVILKAYRTAASLAEGKKKKCTQDVPSVVKKAKACIKILENQKVRSGYRSTVRDAKELARIFAEWIVRRPQTIREGDCEIMNRLLELTAEYEAANVQLLRQRKTLGMRINLGKILGDPAVLKRILIQEADRIVEGMFKDTKTVSLGRRGLQICYTTASGKKYHLKGCPYCKGREIYPVSGAMIDHLSLVPCACITGRKALPLSQEQMEKKAVTIFVDESVRVNPFFRYDNHLPEYEGIYSYVICRGKLESEDEITDQNLVKECASFADDCTEDLNNTAVTIEAIYNALIWTAYRYDFHGEVYLFTDNLGVIGKLKREGTMLHLEKLFEKVTLRHISRKNNKRADMVGRKETLFHASPEVIGDLLKTKEIAEALKEAEEKGPVTKLQDIMKKKQINMIAMLE